MPSKDKQPSIAERLEKQNEDFRRRIKEILDKVPENNEPRHPGDKVS